MIAPPPGAVVVVTLRNGTKITGRMRSFKRGVVEVGGQRIPAARITRWKKAP